MEDGCSGGIRELITLYLVVARHPLEPYPKPMATDKGVEVALSRPLIWTKCGLLVRKDCDGGGGEAEGPLNMVLKSETLAEAMSTNGPRTVP